MGVCTSSNLNHLSPAVRMRESSQTADAPAPGPKLAPAQLETGARGKLLCRLKPLFLEPATADSTPKSECPKQSPKDFEEVSPSQDSEHSQFYVIRSEDVTYKVPLLLDPTNSSISHRRQRRLVAKGHPQLPQQLLINLNGSTHPVDPDSKSAPHSSDMKLFQHPGIVDRYTF